MLIMFCLLLSTKGSGNYYERYSCVIGGNETVINLLINQIAFFETPKFPILLSTDEFNACRLTFNLIYNNISNHQLIVTQEQRSIFEFDQTVDISNDSSYSLINNYPYIDRLSQQGYIIFADESNYPLESIAKTKPFHLNDETQILYLLSSFEEYFNRTYPCIWKFSAPVGYGFKIVVMRFVISASTSFTVTNTTEIIVNERSLTLFRPYYNTDNHIQIELSQGDPEFIPKIEFEAFVSIVEKDIPKTDGHCNISIQDNTTLWSIENYKSNSYCIYNLTIIPNTEIIITGEVDVENNTDYVGYYADKYTKVILPIEIDIVLRNDKNDGSVRNVLFEFMICQCADQVIYCNTFENYNLMKGSDYYCANLHCKFRINCSDPLTVISIGYLGGTNPDQPLFDVFKIYSNNETIFESIQNYDLNYQPKNIFMNSSNENFFEAFTYDAIGPREFFITAAGVQAKKVDRIIEISTENPTVIIDTQEQLILTLIVVELSKSSKAQNKTIMVYTSSIDDVEIYNNESLTYNVQSFSCFIKPNEYSCKMRSDKFVIYLEFLRNFPFLAVHLPGIAPNCVYNNAIFQTKGADNLTIASLANTEGSCIITVLIDAKNFVISHIWTSTKEENVIVFVGIDQTKLFFEFNSKTATTWKDILLLSKVYTVVIPKSTAIFITLNRFNSENSIAIQQPFRSVIATSYYGTLQNNVPSMNVIYTVGNTPVKFIAVDYNVVNDEFYFSSNSVNFYINKTGDYLIFKNQNVTIYYTSFIHYVRIFGALFYIETIEDSL